MPTPSVSEQSLWQVNGHFGGSLPMSDRGLAYGDGLLKRCLFSMASVHWLIGTGRDY